MKKKADDAGETAAVAKKKKAPARKRPATKRTRAKTKPDVEVEPAAAVEDVEDAELIDEVPPPDATMELSALDLEEVVDAEIVAETPADEAPAADATGETEAVEAAEALSPEEQELTAIYGEDLAAPATAHAEYQD